MPSDLLIVDYLGLMAADDKILDRSVTYSYYKAVAEELRNIAKNLDIPVVTAVQLNRTAQGEKGGTKSIVTAAQLAESRGILDTCDFFGSIIQTMVDRRARRFWLTVDKNRYGVVGDILSFEVRYDYMQLTPLVSEMKLE